MQIHETLLTFIEMRTLLGSLVSVAWANNTELARREMDGWFQISICGSPLFKVWGSHRLRDSPVRMFNLVIAMTQQLRVSVPGVRSLLLHSHPIRSSPGLLPSCTPSHPSSKMFQRTRLVSSALRPGHPSQAKQRRIMHYCLCSCRKVLRCGCFSIFGGSIIPTVECNVHCCSDDLQDYVFKLPTIFS